MNNLIVLIGYMGSGKSSVAKVLSSKLKTNHIDLDQFIESSEGISISNIFKKKGEINFRKIERKYLENILKSKKYSIISLGGGTPCYFDNIEFINKFSNNTIFLKTSINELTERLFIEKDDRPIISHLKSKKKLNDFIAKHLFERNKFYNKTKIVIDTDKKGIEEIVGELLDKLA